MLVEIECTAEQFRQKLPDGTREVVLDSPDYGFFALPIPAEHGMERDHWYKVSIQEIDEPE